MRYLVTKNGSCRGPSLSVLLRGSCRVGVKADVIALYRRISFQNDDSWREEQVGERRTIHSLLGVRVKPRREECIGKTLQAIGFQNKFFSAAKMPTQSFYLSKGTKYGHSVTNLGFVRSEI